MEFSEFEVVSRLRRGDKEAYIQLFQNQYKGLVSYAKKYVMDTEIARDLVQDVFIYLWEKRHNLSIETSINSYMFRAVHNKCINHLKKESTKADYVREFLLNLNGQAIQTTNAEDVHELVVFKDLSERIDLLVESLPEQCRNIFRMSRFRGMKNKEIAEIYSISVRTVETQIYRALKVLKENLQPNLTFAISLIIVLIKSI